MTEVARNVGVAPMETILRYDGLGCRRAVENINGELNGALAGKDFATQQQFDEAIIALARSLRFYGMEKTYYAERHGYNSRLDEVHASLAGKTPADFLPEQPLSRITIRQTVGLADPLPAFHGCVSVLHRRVPAYVPGVSVRLLPGTP